MLNAIIEEIIICQSGYAIDLPIYVSLPEEFEIIECYHDVSMDNFRLVIARDSNAASYGDIYIFKLLQEGYSYDATKFGLVNVITLPESGDRIYVMRSFTAV